MTTENATYQTLAEIERAYPDQWVLIDRPRENRYQELLGGTVVFNSRQREDVYDKIGELELPLCAVRFTGKEPADKVYCL
jgi:hypothetical protein